MDTALQIMEFMATNRFSGRSGRMRLHLRARIAVALLVCSPVGVVRAQTHLVHEVGGVERLVGGVVALGPGYVDAGRLYPLDVGGSFRFAPAEEFAEPAVELNFNYTLMASPRVEGSWVEYAQVRVFAAVSSKSDVAGLFFACAWVDDDQLTHVSFRSIPRIQARESWGYQDVFTIRREQAGGFLWCGVFAGGQPLSMTGPGLRSRSATDLLDAIKTGDTQRRDQALSAGAKWSDLNANDAGWMAENGRLDDLQQWALGRRLWQRQVGPDLLWRAVATGRRAVVEWLLDEGVDPERRNQHGVSVLAAAMNSGQWDMIPLILSKRSGKFRQISDGVDPLVLAALAGRADTVALLEEAGLEWPRGQTNHHLLLWQMVNRNHEEAVRILLEKGTRIDGGLNRIENVLSLLADAAKVGNPAVMAMLLKQAPDWSKAERSRNTGPLYFAVVNDRLEVLKLLIESGANPHAEILSGQSDLVTLALQHGSERIARYLLELGIKPTALVDHASFIWSRTMENRRFEIAELLHELNLTLPVESVHPALVEQAVAEDFQPLLKAAMNGGWSAASDMDYGWNLAGVMKRFGRTIPAELVDEQVAPLGPAIVNATTSPQVLKRVAPRYPRERALSGESGEVLLELLLTPPGKVWMPKVLEETAPEFGFAARRASEHWEFSPLSEGQSEWRRLRLPITFTPSTNSEDFVPLGLVDQAPVPTSIPALTPPGDARADEVGVAYVSLMIDYAGDVVQSHVDQITDERWRESVQEGVKRWKFRPAIENDKAVRTRLDCFVRFPAASIVPAEGLALPAVGIDPNAYSMPVMLRSPIRNFAGELRGRGGIVLLAMEVSTSGRARNVRVLAASAAELGELCVESAPDWKFRAARIDGEKVAQEIVLPIRFGRVRQR